MSEGLEYKMKEEIHNAEDFTSFLRQIKSKRYTYARLRRLCLYTLLNVTEKEMQASYQDVSTLLLGYNSRGRNYLKKIRKDVELPIISKVDKKNAASGTLGLQVRVLLERERIRPSGACRAGHDGIDFLNKLWVKIKTLVEDQSR